MPTLVDLAAGQPGWVHPGAAPLAADHASASVGLASVSETFIGIASGSFHFDESLGAMARGAWAPTDRLMVNGAAALYLEGLDDPIPLGTLGLRWNAIQGEHWNFALFGDLGLGRWPQWLGGAGLAVEGGGERVRMDASLPLLGLFRMPISGCDDCEARDLYTFMRPLEMALFSELGVSVALGERDALRLGTTSWLPSLRWRRDLDPWALDLGLGVLYDGYRSTEILLISGERRW